MQRGILVTTVVLMAAGNWALAGLVVRVTLSVARELTDADRIAQLPPKPQATLVFDREGRHVFSFFTEQRIDVPLDRVSPHMVEALLAVEDRRFRSHRGLDPIRIAAAAWRNGRAGRIVEGGSTLTQQLARVRQLSPVRTFSRKVREAMVALALERRYSKAEILQEYLNTVYFGEGFYGVEAASRGYFGKPALELQPGEAALLAALVRSPSIDSPAISVSRATRRRDLVLRLMHRQKRISDAELHVALASPVPQQSIPGPETPIAGSATRHGLYFQEEVRRQLVALFGSERVLQGGLRVYTTYDPVLQAAAEEAITTRVQQIARSRRGAADLQGSLVAMEPDSGDVLALVGGRNFQESSFNRATQARRQAGSAFKPIIYAAALELGYAPGSLLRELDTPIAAGEGPWLPSGEHEDREYTVRQALRVSSNRAAAQLLQRLGVSTAVYYAHRLGIASTLPVVPSLALGTGEVTLLELTAAYSAFANRGVAVAPRIITRVEDAGGGIVWTPADRRVQVLRETTAFLMSSMLADVVTRGTAAGVRQAGFTLPAAGKTGTTNDYADAWFIGYTPRLLAGVWFGLDRPAPIMNRGFAGRVAVPAWARFMRDATSGAKAQWYETPRDVEKLAMCRLTGLRATDACRHGVVRAAYPVPASMTWGSSLPSPESRESPELPPDEPPVYEDLFQSGSAPAEVCRTHVWHF